MAFRELIVLLPCHSLEDFPTYLETVEADNLLTCCTALWHPAMLDAVRKLPTWCRADVLPLDLADTMLVVPQVCEGWLPCDFAERVEAEKPLVLRTEAGRDDLVRQALAALPEAKTFDAATVADFHALGFCRLHVELLTRILRYTTTIDDIRLQSDVLTTVDAAATGDREKTRELLQRCFELLCESRRYFFPVDPYLIDLTLLAESTLGDTLRQELSSAVPGNLLVCGQVVEQMAEREPESVAAVRSAVAESRVSLVGGEYAEREFPLLPEEVWRAELLRGVAVYERVLGNRPVIYGRRRAGLSPVLPQLLCRTGFLAALHFTLDDGQFPITPNAKTRWESADGSVVEALAQIPLDAAQATPFLELPRRLGEALDREQVASLVFAHWPASSCVWYEDLRRASRYAPALGKFVTLEEYFSKTLTATTTAQFEPDDYRLPYLQQAWGERDTISRRRELFAEAIAGISNSALDTISATIVGSASETGRRQWAERFAAVSATTGPARFVANGGTTLRAVEGVAVPALGFAWLAVESTAAKPNLKLSVEPLTLGNEYFRLSISPETGGIQSIYNERGRGNRVSQQIAIRSPGARGLVGGVWRDPDESASYSKMIAESTALDASDGSGGTIVSRGRFEAEHGKLLARFTQRTTVAPDSRVVTLAIELEMIETLGGFPWDNYCAVRCAFPDAELTVRRTLGLAIVETKRRRRIEEPLLLQVAEGRRVTSILPGGLPFHRRVGHRTIDTLLAVRGETATSFTMAIGVDLPNPVHAALESLTPVWETVVSEAPPVGTTGWLFHIDARNVIPTAWEPTGGGFRVRLQETVGAVGRVCLRSWKSIATARQTDFLGSTLCELGVEDDKIVMEIRPYQWIQVEATFAS